MATLGCHGESIGFASHANPGTLRCRAGKFNREMHATLDIAQPSPELSTMSRKRKILIVDDEPDALELLEYNLRQAGHGVVLAEDGQQALDQARNDLPELILLDLMLPEVDGVKVCRTLKANPATQDIPIIMVTAKAAEIDRVLGLELGADDYVTKPFSPRELVLRVGNLLNRGQREAASPELFKIGGLTIDHARHLVTVDGTRLELTATEFKLLATLAERRGRVQDRERLLQDVWGYDRYIDTRTVDTHMRRLRAKLGATAVLLQTVRGAGYRFTDEEF